MSGSDSSDEKRALYAHMVESTHFGSLQQTYGHNKRSNISNGEDLLQVIPSDDYGTKIQINYTGNENYFTTPKKTFNGTQLYHKIESFTITMHTDSNSSSSNSSIGVSLPTTHYIEIQNINDPTEISITQRIF